MSPVNFVPGAMRFMRLLIFKIMQDPCKIAFGRHPCVFRRSEQRVSGLTVWKRTKRWFRRLHKQVSSKRFQSGSRRKGGMILTSRASNVWHLDSMGKVCGAAAAKIGRAIGRTRRAAVCGRLLQGREIHAGV
jgi:hypothetical protein